jgi:hypothetical protein
MQGVEHEVSGAMDNMARGLLCSLKVPEQEKVTDGRRDRVRMDEILICKIVKLSFR